MSQPHPADVTVRKVITGPGERLEIQTQTGRRIRLDALALESISWQPPDFLTTRLDITPPQTDHDHDGDIHLESPHDELTIVNEYAHIRVSLTHTPHGPRITIAAPKAGYDISLQPWQLRALTTQPPDFTSQFLQTPYGPEK